MLTTTPQHWGGSLFCGCTERSGAHHAQSHWQTERACHTASGHLLSKTPC